jgi:hypothetical protein
VKRILVCRRSPFFGIECALGTSTISPKIITIKKLRTLAQSEVLGGLYLGHMLCIAICNIKNDRMNKQHPAMEANRLLRLLKDVLKTVSNYLAKLRIIEYNTR